MFVLDPRTRGRSRPEVARHRVDDVDPATGIVVVRSGKGGEFRKKLIGPEATSAVVRYRMERPPSPSPGTRMPGCPGAAAYGGPEAKNAVWICAAVLSERSAL